LIGEELLSEGDGVFFGLFVCCMGVSNVVVECGYVKGCCVWWNEFWDALINRKEDSRHVAFSEAGGKSGLPVFEDESAFDEFRRPCLVMVPWICALFGIKHRFCQGAIEGFGCAVHSTGEWSVNTQVHKTVKAMAVTVVFELGCEDLNVNVDRFRVSAF
jgi:hypothetical protein